MLNKDDQGVNSPQPSDKFPSNFRIADKTTALDYYVEIGDKYWQQENITEAIAYYRQALQIEPTCLRACQKLATALKQQGNLEEAAGYLYQAIQYQQDNTKTSAPSSGQTPYFNRTNNSYEALRDVVLNPENLTDSSLTIQSRNLKPQTVEGVSHIQFESKDGMTIIHDTSEFIEPSQWHRKLTVSSQPQKTFDEEMAVRKALKQAIEHLANNQYRKAIELCQQVIERFPEFAEAYKTKGNIFQKLDQLSQAIECYKKAIEIDPEYTEVYANLGGIYAQQKQWKHSIIYYQKASLFLINILFLFN